MRLFYYTKSLKYETLKKRSYEATGIPAEFTPGRGSGENFLFGKIISCQKHPKEKGFREFQVKYSS